MSILDIKKTSIKYLFISLLTLIFGFIYELFSHEVYSNYMIFAFLIPLIGGSVIFLILYILKINNTNILAINCYHSLIATLTIESIIKGILDIYGTTNYLLNCYIYAGITLTIITFILLIIKRTN